MVFGIKLARLGGMMGGVGVMAVCHMGMMACLLDIVVAMVLGSLAMVLRGFLVMMGGLLMVIDNFIFRHGSRPLSSSCRIPGDAIRVKATALHLNDN
jgi:hypothetical protein